MGTYIGVDHRDYIMFTYVYAEVNVISSVEHSSVFKFMRDKNNRNNQLGGHSIIKTEKNNDYYLETIVANNCRSYNRTPENDENVYIFKNNCWHKFNYDTGLLRKMSIIKEKIKVHKPRYIREERSWHENPRRRVR